MSSRRKFIADTAKAGLALGMGAAWLESCTPASRLVTTALPATGLAQKPLPYAYNALEPAIDAMTMEIHYTKHAAAYSKNLTEEYNTVFINTNAAPPLETVLTYISKYSAKMRNNGGGHYNHELFWQCLTPNGAGKPQGALLQAIETQFSAFDTFKTQLSDAAKTRFGSGWAWLVLGDDKKLKIGSTPNQDNPLMDVSELKGTPLLALDVWEHAYYLKYQNKRADYINNWWNIVNWKFVEERYEKLVGKS
jgi:superoxide dismutase, Fe-Mn family